jgi:hypothetical protein
MEALATTLSGEVE